MKIRQTWRLPKRNGFCDRLNSGVSVTDHDWGDELLEFDYLQMAGNLDGKDGIFQNSSLKRSRAFSQSRRQEELFFITGDEQTGAETDDDSLLGILGKPYEPPHDEEGKSDPTVIHLKYAIPRNEGDTNQRHEKSIHIRNPLNRIPWIKQKKWNSIVSNVRSRVPKFTPPQIFRRRKNLSSRDDLLEAKSSTTKPNSGIPETIVGNFPNSQTQTEWSRQSIIRNAFRLPNKRQTTKSSNESYDVWSNVSSIEESSYSESEYISFDELSTSSFDSNSTSLFSELMEALDDIANFAFLGDDFQCGAYEEPRRKVGHRSSNRINSGYC